MRTWLVAAVLVAVAMTPMLNSTQMLEDEAPVAPSGPLQVSFSATSGWTSGGEDLTITGTGFRGMADRNVTYDGINHQWTKTTADYTDESLSLIHI